MALLAAIVLGACGSPPPAGALEVVGSDAEAGWWLLEPVVVPAGSGGESSPEAEPAVPDPCTTGLRIPSGLLFGVASADLQPGAEQLLATVADQLVACEVTVDVTGHTDTTGTEAFNDRLAVDRAERVAATLQRSGVPADQLRTVGCGWHAPVESNDTAWGRSRNRRVEIAPTAAATAAGEGCVVTARGG